MLAVADTHAFVWLVTGQEKRLGRAARRLFQEAERGRSEIRLSVISLYEIALLVERDRLRPDLDWAGWMRAARTTPGLAVEPLQGGDVDHARGLPGLVDPFDRLVAATAMRLRVPLITADQRIAGSKRLDVVWD